LRIALFLVLAVVVAAASWAGGGRESGELIAAEDALEAVNSGEAIFVDVRDEASYLQSHIAGALSAPLREISNWVEEFESRGVTVITYCACPAEETSLAAAAQLISSGFRDVVVLKGGIQGWDAAGLPLRAGPRP
jgi:rhodanese-related sulfurtransferase